MKFFALLIVALPVWGAVDLGKHFKNQEGCFLLYDLQSGKRVQSFGGKACEAQYPACSTFKVPLALIATEKKLILDENTIFKWDGQKHEIQAWNKDANSASWISDSVVWVSQRLALQLGQKTVEKYLKDFAFGTADMSGGIDKAWLPGVAEKPTVLISAEEQIKFIMRLWKGELPVSVGTTALVKKLLLNEKQPSGAQIYGKTGSGILDAEKRLGWFVAVIEGNGRQHAAVIRVTGPKSSFAAPYPGYEARSKMKQILSELGL